MLYLKRKSDGKGFFIDRIICSRIKLQSTVFCELGKIMIPSDEYELIFKS